MKRSKRILSLVLVFALVLTAAVAPAVAVPERSEAEQMPTVLLEDDFSGDLSKWTAVNNAQIVDGKVQIGANGFIQFAAEAWTDYTLEFDADFKGSPYRGVSFRRQEVTGDDYFWWFGDGNTNIKVVKRTNAGATWQDLTNVQPSVAFSDMHHFKLEVNGSSIKTYVDGSLYNSGSCGDFTNGGILFFVAAGTATFDNVKVTSLTSEGGEGEGGEGEGEGGETPDPSGVLLEDDFSGDLSKWNVQNGVITDGKLVLGNAGSGVINALAEATVGSDWTNYTLEFDADFSGQSYRGISFRRQSNGDDYFWWFGDGNTKIKIVKRVGGAWTDISDIHAPVALSGMHHFKLVVNGSTIKAYVDGQLWNTASDESFTTGGILFFVNYAAAQFDNVKVTAITGEGGEIEPETPETLELPFTEDFSGDLSKWDTQLATVKNGSLYLGTASGGNVSATATVKGGSNWTNYTLEFDADMKGHPYRGIRFRVQANGDDYFWWFGDGNTNLKVVKRVGGAWTDISDVKAVSAQSGNHHYKIEVNGATIKTYMDGTLLNTGYDTAFASGGIGFHVAYDVAAFDNVKVTAIEGGAEDEFVVPEDAFFSDDFASDLSKWHNKESVITDGRLQLGTAGSTTESWVTPTVGSGWTDYVLEFDADWNGKPYRGISFRRQDNGDDYFWWFGDGNTNIKMVKRVGGVWTDISDTKPAMTLVGPRHFKLVVQGNKFSAYVDDVLFATGTDDAFATGGFLLYAGNDVAWIDNVVVRPVRTDDVDTNTYAWDTDGDGVLEIMAIGNSFSEDALQYAWQIATDLGIKNVVVGNVLIGGSTLKMHAENIAGDLPKYIYYYNDDGTWSLKRDVAISEALNSRSWDFVSIQQGSGSSGVESTYNEDLTNVIAYLKANSSAKLVWHMTWAYQNNCSHQDFPKYDRDQMTMYNAIVATVQNKICTNDAFDMIVPSGTAVQNARTSGLGDTLTRDGYHMSYSMGRYTTGLMFIKTLTGLDISGIGYAANGVTDYQKQIAIESVNNAAAQPFAVTQSLYTEPEGGQTPDTPDTPTPEAPNFTEDFSGDLSQWVTEGATITDGRLQLGTAGGGNTNALATVTVGQCWTDYVLEFDADFNGQSYRGISFRRQANGDDYLWWFGDGNSNIQIVKRVSGGWEGISDIQPGNALIGTHHFKLVVKGNTFKAYVDGQLWNTATDDTLATGEFLFLVAYDTAFFDNVVVREITDEDLNGGSQQPEYEKPEFSDDFSGDLSKWNTQNATLSSGKLQLGTPGSGSSNGTAWATPTVGSGWTNYVLEFDADFRGESYRGISFRRQTNGNDYLWWFGDGASNIKIVKRDGGNWTEISNAQPGTGMTGNHHFKLVVQDDTFYGFVDGTLFVTGKDDSYTTGGVLLMVDYESAVFDNVVVREVSEEDLKAAAGSEDSEIPNFKDNFSGNLNNWIKDKATISGGMLQLGTPGGGVLNAYATPSVGSSWTDYVIEFDADFNGQSYRGVSFRRQDNGDDYLWWFGDGVSNVSIVKRVNGSWTPIGNVQPSKPLKGSHHFKVVVKGNTFTTFVDGEIYNIATDSSLKKGGFMFMLTYDAAWFDNVVVREYKAGDEYGKMANEDLWPEANINEDFVVAPEKWDGEMYEVNQGRVQIGKQGGGTLEAYYGPQGGYSWTDYVVEFDADFGDEYYRGLCFRRQKTGGDYMWWFGDGGLGTLIMKRTATGWSVVGDVQPAKKLSGTHHLKLVVKGNQFLTFVDGVICNSGTDDTYTQGGIQFFVNYDAAWIDNVVVRTVEPADLETGVDKENPIPDLHEDFESGLDGWNVENGELEDGKLRLGAIGGGELYAYAAPLVGKNWTDYVLTVDFNFGGQPYRGISFRRQDNGDDYLLWFGDSELGTQIVKRVGGGWEPISESYPDMKLGGGEHRIKLEVKGSQFKVWVDGAPILTATDEELTKGGILFFVNYEAAWIDNVSVTVPGEETTQLVPDSYEDDPFEVDGWQFEEAPLQEVPVGTDGEGSNVGLIMGIVAAAVVLAAGVAVAIIVPAVKKKKVTQ